MINVEQKIRQFIREEIKTVMNDRTLGLAKSAIRDIFIQYPSRTVSFNNWTGFKDFIIGNYGKEIYRKAMAQLMRDGWLSKQDTYYQWKKWYKPVNQKNEDSGGSLSGMEINYTERDKAPKNWSKIPPTDEKSFDKYRNQNA